ncbi:MAG: ABC transporter ATP-binding protein [Planctomycetes bacterium]|nr:ABC transporter ATP-binding protein [Planctomycetota bacterium]
MKTLAELVMGLPRRLIRGGRKDGLGEYEFWALNDLSFEVQAGETLGVIGPNGAGKSTILKLLFHIMSPDKGCIDIAGRVGGLIELGAGFHPYLSGRENVFINGSILGMKQREIRKQYASIVAFAELAEFMDMPVKNFSSGMYARLAFAIAAHAAPDVLIVDEVLAVGDVSFQLKCYDWLAQRRKNGKTTVIVSHDMYAMAASSRCLYIDGGRMQSIGEPRGVIDAYLARSRQARGGEGRKTFVPGKDGKARAEITQVEMLSGGQAAETIDPGENLLIRFHYNAHEPITSPMLALSLFHADGRFPITTNHYLFHVYSGDLLKGQTISGQGVLEVEVPDVHLPVGNYRAKTYFFEGHATNLLFEHDGAAWIEVTRPGYSDGRAMIDHRQNWRVPVKATTT